MPILLGCHSPPSHSSPTSSPSPNLLSTTSKTSFIHAFVWITAIRVHGKTLDRLHYVQNLAARVFSSASSPGSTSPPHSSTAGSRSSLTSPPKSSDKSHHALLTPPSTYQMSFTPRIPSRNLWSSDVGSAHQPPAPTCRILATEPSVWQPAPPSGTLSR